MRPHVPRCAGCDRGTVGSTGKRPHSRRPSGRRLVCQRGARVALARAMTSSLSSKLLAFALSAPCTLITAGGCSSLPTSSVEAAHEAPPPRTPAQHVSEVSNACGSARPSGVTASDVIMGCRSDAECLEGLNGRCVGSGMGITVCSYDECRTDADCGDGAFCNCRGAQIVGGSTNNICVRGSDCRSDGDCGGPYCSPSLVPDECAGTSLRFLGYFCHSARDECIDDGDCRREGPSSSAGGNDTCDYDTAARRWRCSVRKCEAD